MAEKSSMRNENIKQVSEFIKEGKIEAFIQSSNKFALEIKGIKSVLEEKLKNLELKRVEEDKQKVETQVNEQPEIKKEKVDEVKVEEKPVETPVKEVKEEVKPQVEETLMKEYIQFSKSCFPKEYEKEKVPNTWFFDENNVSDQSIHV